MRCSEKKRGNIFDTAEGFLLGVECVFLFLLAKNRGRFGCTEKKMIIEPHYFFDFFMFCVFSASVSLFYFGGENFDQL